MDSSAVSTERFAGHVVGPRFNRASLSAAPSCVPSRRNGVVPQRTDSGRPLRPSVIFSAQKLHITVGGCSAFYSAELSCAPDHPVTISPSNLPTCVRISPSLQVFTKDNWHKPQFFRVAATATLAYEESKEDTKFLQVLEHISSSTDVRFHGNRLMYLPSTMLIQVSPREGWSVVASGRVLGSARQVGKGTANMIHHDFRPVECEQESSYGSYRDTARGSVVGSGRASMLVGNAQAVAQVASQALSPRRLNSRQSFHTSASASSGQQDHGSVYKETHSFVKVACCKNQTLLLQRNGRMVELGKRDIDALAIPNNPPPSPTSRATDDSESGVSDAALCKMLCDLDCGDDHVVAITEHGYLLTWGEGKDGRLGHGSEASRSSPRLIKTLLHKRIVQVACGARHSLALAEDGDVYAWGYGKSGALGLGMSPQSKGAVDSCLTPMEVITLKQKGVAKISCGDMHTAVVLINGTLLTCGWAEHGRLGRVVGGATKGDAEYSSCFAPVDMKGKLCTFVACGGAHTLAMTACRLIYAFGSNGSGQLGLGDCRHRFAPTRIAYFEAGEDNGLVLTGIAAGKLHSLAMAQDTRVFAWGSDEFGQCGIGSFPQIYTVPHLVPSAVGLDVAQVAGGDSHSVLLCRSSQSQLDALEANHPVRYAALMDRFEAMMKEDKIRRASVLQAAKHKQDVHEANVRQRKPPLDPSILRGVGWQKRLQAAEKAAQDIVDNTRAENVAKAAVAIVSAQKPRPQTATSTSKGSATGKAVNRMVRPATGGAVSTYTKPPRPATATKDKPKVRCSSATMWRQTRLFIFQAPSPAPSATSGTQSDPSKSSSSPETGKSVSSDSSRGKRPSSASFSRLKLTPQARQSLGRIFHDEPEISQPKAITRAEGVGQTPPDKVEEVRSAAQFPASRPKSAPSRAAVSSTRAS